MRAGLALIGATFVLAAPDAPAQKSGPFAEVEACAQKAVDEGTVAGGTLLVWHDGEVVLHTAFGFSDLERRRPFGKNTPCVVASISKPLLGTALHRLVDRGRLDPEAAIDRYLPEFAGARLESGDPLARLPTLTELLTHSSGLRPDNAKGGRVWFQDWTRGEKLEVVVDRIAREFPFKAEPGTRFAYSGIGTEVAARIGEVASGLPRNEFLIAALTRPLGMRSTFYPDAAGMKWLAVAMPTRYLRSKNTGKLVVYRGRPVPATNAYSSSGGAMVSTAPDLLRWLLVLRNDGLHEGDRYLKNETVAAMLAPHGIGKNARGGLFVRETGDDGKPLAFGHTGSSGTNVWFHRGKDVIGIMLTQTRGSDIKPFRIELERLAMEAVARLDRSSQAKPVE